MKKRLAWSFIILAIFSLIGYYRFGLFTPYNYFTAKYDLMKGNVRVLYYGMQEQNDDSKTAIAKERGFNYERVAGCIVTYELVNGVEAYNSVVNDYLINKLGKDWEKEFYKDSEVEFIKNSKTIPAIKSPDCSFSIIYKLNDSVDINLGLKTYVKDTCKGYFYSSSNSSIKHAKLKMEDVINVLNSQFKKLEDSSNFQLTGIHCPIPTQYIDLYTRFYEAFSTSAKWKKFYEAYSKYPEKYKHQFRVDYDLIEDIIVENNLYKAYLKVFQKEGYKVKGIMIEKVDLIPIEDVESRIKNWNIRRARVENKVTILKIPFPMSIDVRLEK